MGRDWRLGFVERGLEFIDSIPSADVEVAVETLGGYVPHGAEHGIMVFQGDWDKGPSALSAI